VTYHMHALINKYNMVMFINVTVWSLNLNQFKRTIFEIIRNIFVYCNQTTK
jgi:hypothetical protein